MADSAAANTDPTSKAFGMNYGDKDIYRWFHNRYLKSPDNNFEGNANDIYLHRNIISKETNQSIQLRWLGEDTKGGREQILSEAIGVAFLSPVDCTLQVVTFPTNASCNIKADGLLTGPTTSLGPLRLGNHSPSLLTVKPVAIDTEWLFGEIMAFLPENGTQDPAWSGRYFESMTHENIANDEIQYPQIDAFPTEATAIGFLPVMLPITSTVGLPVKKHGDKLLARLEPNSVMSTWAMIWNHHHRWNNGKSLPDIVRHHPKFHLSPLYTNFLGKDGNLRLISIEKTCEKTSTLTRTMSKTIRTLRYHATMCYVLTDKDALAFLTRDNKDAAINLQKLFDDNKQPNYATLKSLYCDSDDNSSDSSSNDDDDDDGDEDDGDDDDDEDDRDDDEDDGDNDEDDGDDDEEDGDENRDENGEDENASDGDGDGDGDNASIGDGDGDEKKDTMNKDNDDNDDKGAGTKSDKGAGTKSESKKRKHSK